MLRVRLKKPQTKIGVGGLEISDYEKQLVNEVLNSNRLTYGPVTKKFEEAFAKLHDCEFALFMNSGTSALHVSLKLVDVKKGDEVIVPSMTFIAPVNAIKYNNAKPIFMDCDEYYTIDVNKTVDFIDKETRVIKKKISGKNLTITINKKTGNAK